MKLLNVIILVLMCTLFTTTVEAQKNEAKYKKTIENILKLSKTKKFKKAAGFIAYSLDDSKRKFKDSFNPSNSKELREVRRICKKINALLLISDSYDIGKVSSSKFHGVNSYSVVVEFKSGKQVLKLTFIFIKDGEKVLLAGVE